MHRRWGIAALSLLLATGSGIAAEEPGKAAAASDGVQRVEVRMSNYRFDPDLIVLRKGVPVELTLKNESALTPHEFVVEDPALRLDAEVEAYASTVLSFTPMTAGEFRFACKKKLPFMKSHEKRGMHGILRIENGAGAQLEKPGLDSGGPGGSR